MEKTYQRSIPVSLSNIHVREAEGDNESRVVEGHAVVFGQRSLNLTPWSCFREVYEIMERGCITDELLRSSDVILCPSHDDTCIFGRCRNGKGTLELSIDETGLFMRCDLPRTAKADEILEGIRRGDITGMSFCFTADEEDTENGVSYEHLRAEDHDGMEVWLRHVKKCTSLRDVSIVGRPAYEQTDVSNRDIDSAIEQIVGKESNLDEQKRSENDDADKAAEQARKEKEMQERSRRIADLRREIDIYTNID